MGNGVDFGLIPLSAEQKGFTANLLYSNFITITRYGQPQIARAAFHVYEHFLTLETHMDGALALSREAVSTSVQYVRRKLVSTVVELNSYRERVFEAAVTIPMTLDEFKFRCSCVDSVPNKLQVQRMNLNELWNVLERSAACAARVDEVWSDLLDEVERQVELECGMPGLLEKVKMQSLGDPGEIMDYACDLMRLCIENRASMSEALENQRSQHLMLLAKALRRFALSAVPSNFVSASPIVQGDPREATRAVVLEFDKVAELCDVDTYDEGAVESLLDLLRRDPDSLVREHITSTTPAREGGNSHDGYIYGAYGEGLEAPYEIPDDELEELVKVDAPESGNEEPESGHDLGLEGSRAGARPDSSESGLSVEVPDHSGGVIIPRRNARPRNVRIQTQVEQGRDNRAQETGIRARTGAQETGTMVQETSGIRVQETGTRVQETERSELVRMNASDQESEDNSERLKTDQNSSDADEEDNGSQTSDGDDESELAAQAKENGLDEKEYGLDGEENEAYEDCDSQSDSPDGYLQRQILTRRWKHAIDVSHALVAVTNGSFTCLFQKFLLSVIWGTAMSNGDNQHSISRLEPIMDSAGLGPKITPLGSSAVFFQFLSNWRVEYIRVLKTIVNSAAERMTLEQKKMKKPSCFFVTKQIPSAGDLSDALQYTVTILKDRNDATSIVIGATLAALSLGKTMRAIPKQPHTFDQLPKRRCDFGSTMMEIFSRTLQYFAKGLQVSSYQRNELGLGPGSYADSDIKLKSDFMVNSEPHPKSESLSKSDHMLRTGSWLASHIRTLASSGADYMSVCKFFCTEVFLDLNFSEIS